MSRFKNWYVNILSTGLEDVAFAAWEWLDCFNNRRLLQPIGNIPPAEFEMLYYLLFKESAEVAWHK
jgi:putative transposase